MEIVLIRVFFSSQCYLLQLLEKKYAEFLIVAVKCAAILSTEFIYFRDSCSMAISRILEALECQSGDLKAVISRTAQSNYCDIR